MEHYTQDISVDAMHSSRPGLKRHALVKTRPETSDKARLQEQDKGERGDFRQRSYLGLGLRPLCLDLGVCCVLFGFCLMGIESEGERKGVNVSNESDESSPAVYGTKPVIYYNH